MQGDAIADLQPEIGHVLGLPEVEQESNFMFECDSAIATVLDQKILNQCTIVLNSTFVEDE